MAYSTELYENARREMERRRTIAEQELDRRRSELFEKCPEAQSIEENLTKISVAAGRAVLSGADIRSELEALKDKSLRLQERLDDLLVKNGYGKNWLEEWYVCKKCGDKGFVDGKMCSCMKSLLRQMSYDELNSISPLELSSFESFDLKYYPDQTDERTGKNPNYVMSKALSFCTRYAEEFTTRSHSLIFQGDSGLGKTHLSLAIASKVIEKGYGVIYVSTPAVLSKLENERFYSRGEQRSSTEQLLCECDLLILDDLGTEFSTKFSVAEIYNILNTRMMSSLPTIISTNLTLARIQEQYGSRLVSRVIGGLDRVELIGTDVRQLKRRERKNSK